MGSKANDTSINELNLQSKKIDLLLTIYEKLFNRYQFRARLLDFGLLLASIIVCLTTFVDPKILQFLRIPPERTTMILSASAFCVFAISVISLISGSRNRATNFYRSAEILSKLKAECNDKMKPENQEEARLLQIKAIEFAAIINNLPKIPEKEYHKLKTLHKRRIELGKMIEIYPGSSIWLLKLVVHLRANLNVLLRRPVVDDSVEEAG